MANMTNGHANGDQRGENYPGYQPVTNPSYVDPTSILYQPPESQDAEGDAEFPVIDGLDQDSARRGKRGREAGDDTRRKKKQKVVEEGPISDATKQYRKEQERKALEEARKAGRFIQVHAALKGKSKIVVGKDSFSLQ